MTIQKKMFIPTLVQLLVLVPVLILSLSSRRDSQVSLTQSQERTERITELKDLYERANRYYHEKTHQAELHNEIKTVLDRARTSLTMSGAQDILDAVGTCQGRIVAAKQRNAEIERAITQLTDLSVRQSNGYIEQVATKLADPNQDDSVTTLERLVIIGANINTTSNLTVRSLFYRIASDPAAETELVAFLDNAVENTTKDIQRLANTPFAALPIEAQKANQTIHSLVTEYIGNLKAMAHDKTTLDERLTTLLTDLDQANRQANAAVVASIQRSYLKIGITLVSAAILVVGLTTAITRRLTRTIRAVVGQLRQATSEVTAASSQVSLSSQSLAEGATEQAAGLQETSSSLEEMSAMTRQNADNAQQANVLAADAKRAAGTGAESMSRMNAAIHEIQRSSDETAKIIKVIDEIAFQTNLLALNAAVEAARAGEAGKGFAVVAEEVRNLAMRSAEAAKNTAGMIEESVKNARNGVDIADEVARVLDEIVQSVGKTTDLISEIAAASQEQAQGIDQLNEAVAQMDKVTQQNAANAEESASASEELSAQAENVKNVVDQLVVLVEGNSGYGKNRDRCEQVRQPQPTHVDRGFDKTTSRSEELTDNREHPAAKKRGVLPGKRGITDGRMVLAECESSVIHHP